MSGLGIAVVRLSRELGGHGVQEDQEVTAARARGHRVGTAGLEVERKHAAIRTEPAERGAYRAGRHHR